MIITDAEDKADRIKRLALHGLSKDAWKRFSDGVINIIMLRKQVISTT